MLAAETPRFVWYFLRASGLVSLVLLSATVVLGVVGVTRLKSTRWPQLVTTGLHRNLSLLAPCFLGVHIASAMVDGWIGLRWIGVIVPFQSEYRPLWVGLGALAVDLLGAVVLTSLLRRHLSHRTWRWVHWSTWAIWPLAVSHALGSGSDTTSGAGLGVTLACIAAAAAAAGWRLFSRQRRVASRVVGRTARPGRPVWSAADGERQLGS